MTTLLREVIGDVLRRSRVEQGRTLREVSDSARVSLGYLSEVERGRKEASSELLSAICGPRAVPLSGGLARAGAGWAREKARAATTTGEVPSFPPMPAGTAGIDVSTKVVIPQVASIAVA